MKRYNFLKFGFFALLLVFSFSCEESPINLTPPSAIGFDTVEASVEVLEDTSYDL